MEVRPIDANQIRDAVTYIPWCDYGPVQETIDAAPALSLNTLRDAIYQDAVEHGLWEISKGWCWWPHKCVEMVQSEVDELFAAKEEWGESTDDDNDHFIEELADVVIMCLSVAGKLDIDIDAAIRRKMEFNHNRPWKHGKE